MPVVNLPRVKRYKRHGVEGERAEGTRGQEARASCTYTLRHLAAATGDQVADTRGRITRPARDIQL